MLINSRDQVSGIIHQYILSLTRMIFKEAPQGFLIARDLGANIARALQVSTCKQIWRLDTISRLLSEKVCQNSLTQYSFYVMESWVSSNCTRNIHWPSRPEREVNRKENTVGKIAKRRQIRKSTHALIPILAKFNSIT